MEKVNQAAAPDRGTPSVAIACVEPSPSSVSERPPSLDQLGIVAIGASAGGLEACTALVDALPREHGMALILVQHLEPTHDSMMVELLARHTATAVQQAQDGVPLEPDHLYIIPPGSDLWVTDGVLRLSEPDTRPGLHLPYDVLLHSLADSCGPQAVCVILSGTGADGTQGIQAVKASGGFIIAQDPAEASYGGMPSSAIQTGLVDLVLRAADIPNALLEHDRLRRAHPLTQNTAPPNAVETGLDAIIDLLRVKASRDFSHYKDGTLRRQVARRMALAALPADQIDKYLKLLQKSSAEVSLLAKDLLVQVTSFFRDKAVFDVLGETVIPELIRNHPADRPIRIWTAGCSTGEEIYSIAMVFQEELAKGKRNIGLQLFASDIDAGAIARARDGRYPETIESCVSKGRLARFFLKEAHGYRVSPDLRSTIVFAVHDVLTDPPFAQLDMVSCRNLLIYLRPAAQMRVLSFLHFALRPSGILMLGNAETPGKVEGSYDVVSKPGRLYRRIGRDRPTREASNSNADVRPPLVTNAEQVPPSKPGLMEIAKQFLLNAYAPASVLINIDNRCILSLGPVDRYLGLGPGLQSDDVIAMAPVNLRTTLRKAIGQAREKNARVVTAARIIQNGKQVSFSLEVQPFVEDEKELLLICFTDPSRLQLDPKPTEDSAAPSRVTDLERELKASKTELGDARRDLDQSAEEHKSVDEEARSLNEEYQSTNEELMASKEELQAVNEELTALNSQLQETLERQRTTSDDLQNVLYSTEVATLFLDPELRIRFFTPATRLLFSVISGDVGRPLADLRSLAADDALESDMKLALQGHPLLDREVEAKTGAWFRRRVLPYRTHDNRIEGVVITFNDITSRKNISKALEATKKEAELANAAKSRFLAAASHDLRQPLQTLSLLQGLLAKAVEGERARELVVRLDETLTATTSMLNTLLDINQIEGGLVRPKVAVFQINDLLVRMRDEFNYHAQAKGLSFHVIPCGLSAISDIRLLEQMVRNLLTNALKYTAQGKVLLGCRRHEGKLSLQVWDTGLGLPEQELDAIFEEYHQLANPARERARGLGLGLAIVQLLGGLLNHRITVRSTLGKGSMFALEVPLQAATPARNQTQLVYGASSKIITSARAATILLVEDDPDVRELTELTLTGEGYRVISSSNVAAALDLVAKAPVAPDLILADYNLPGDMHGLDLAGLLRKTLAKEVPVVILTGDISAETASQVALLGCMQLNKPIKQQELLRVVDNLVVSARQPELVSRVHDLTTKGHLEKPTVFVVDDDQQICQDLSVLLAQEGYEVETFLTGEDFLHAKRLDRDGCVLIDAHLPRMSGLDLLHRLRADGSRLTAIMITGSSDVPLAVKAMKAGASDFIEKPVGSTELLASVGAALERSASSIKLSTWQETAADRVSKLTPRQHEIMIMVLSGNPSKNIAADLHISQRTVENHRASIMKKTGVASVPELARLAMAATWTNDGNDYDRVT